MSSLAGKKDKKKELFEEMYEKLKVEIERLTGELKRNQREVDKLEYEGEECEKDLKSSREQIDREAADRERLDEEMVELKR